MTTAIRSTPTPLRAAIAYLGAGMSVIPIRVDGSKAPAIGAWKEYQSRWPTEEEARRWFGDGKAGIAVVCGRVSGNAEVLDFDIDADTIFPAWQDLVEAEAPGLVDRLTIVRTPRGGYHVWYRCPEVDIAGNQKLAMDEEGKVVLIETRAEGGYALVPGCPAACHATGRTYDHHAGPRLSQVQTITPEEREILQRCARSFDRTPPADHHANGHVPHPDGGLSPGDDYCQRGPSWADILEPHGWVIAQQREETTYWRRPGKDGPGWSATSGVCRSKVGHELLAVFSSNASPFPGPSSGRPCSTHSRFGAYTLLNHGGDFRAAARALAQQGFGDRGDRLNGQVSTAAQNLEDNRPILVITAEEHVVNRQALEALAARDSGIYQRDGLGLAHVVRTPEPITKGGVTRPSGTPRIMQLAPALLRERLAAAAKFVVETERDGEIEHKRKHPPEFVVQALANRGEWPGIRPLMGVIDAPILRPDGTILDQPGYDPGTGLLLETSVQVPPVPAMPTSEDIAWARDCLLETVCDFPFAKKEHQAAFLAMLLTPLARHAFAGPAPLFLVDSNVRGSGKGLLCNVVSLIVTGRHAATMSNPSNDEEARKRITAVAIGGDSMILIDNIEEGLGSAALNAALTSTIWKDRLLGFNEMVEMPLLATWFATGNNVVLNGDTARRVCHVRLESSEENPEDRSDFRHPDLRRHVLEHHGQLLCAALTILRGYCAAGRPNLKLRPWGSYEGWTALVRSAIVWAGMPDPGEVRQELRQRADDEASLLRAVVAGIKRMDVLDRGMTTSEILARANGIGWQDDPAIVALREALTNLCEGRGHELPGSKSLGKRLRHFEGRVIGGQRLESTVRANTRVWMVR